MEANKFQLLLKVIQLPNGRIEMIIQCHGFQSNTIYTEPHYLAFTKLYIFQMEEKKSIQQLLHSLLFKSYHWTYKRITLAFALV